MKWHVTSFIGRSEAIGGFSTFPTLFDSRHAVYRCFGKKFIPMSKGHEKTASKKRFSCLFAAEFSLQPREDTIVFLGFNLIEFRDEIFLLLI